MISLAEMSSKLKRALEAAVRSEEAPSPRVPSGRTVGDGGQESEEKGQCAEGGDWGFQGAREASGVWGQ